MFSQACVKNSVHGGVSVPACTTGHMTGSLCLGGGLCPGGLCPGEVSVRETPPYGNKRPVRILLECILVIACRYCDKRKGRVPFASAITHRNIFLEHLKRFLIF